jgi:peptidoglycan/LPS O-acetylase OafA/YrhL
MRPNNFDLTRLCLAIIVVLFHVSVLSAAPGLSYLRYLDGGAAVEGFFVISGFLILASYERSRSLAAYLSKRARRILPAYWLSTLLCICIALAFSRSLHIWRFLFFNLTFLNFLQPGVPGVFSNNPATSALNGALWTIKIEVSFYLFVPVLVWLCRRFGYDLILAGFTLASIACRYSLASHESFSRQLPGQLSFFCIGALAYRHLAHFRKRGWWLLPPAILCYIATAFADWFVLRLLSIPILVLTLSLLVPEIKGPTRWGDFSYGTYVLHFPIIQTIVALGGAHHSYVFLALTIILVGSLAVFSWFFVERIWLPRTQQPRLREMALGQQPMPAEDPA